MLNKENRLDAQILSVKEEKTLTVRFLVGDLILEHRIDKHDRSDYPERSSCWKNLRSKYLNSDYQLPSKEQLKQIALERGAK